MLNGGLRKARKAIANPSGRAQAGADRPRPATAASWRRWLAAFAGLSATIALGPAGIAIADPGADYAEYCAECHGPDRLGAIGPALIPETLGRMQGPNLEAVIADGRAATQMPAFGDTLDDDRIAALADWLGEALAEIPPWGAEQIEASRETNPDYAPAQAPQWDADPMNITLVVETGDHHVSVLDGDTFAVLDRFPTPFAVHGGPKFSPDGRFVFIMSRDGWVQKYDIWTLQEVGRIRAGLNSRNIAISHDGRWLAVANYLPMTLTILSTDDLSVARIIEIESKDAGPSRISAVYQAPQRKSFILALKDAPEIWEVATDVDADPVYEGFVHSREKGMVEGIPSSEGLFARRRIVTEEPMATAAWWSI